MDKKRVIEALEKSLDMWKWIAHNPEKDKLDYLDSIGIPDVEIPQKIFLHLTDGGGVLSGNLDNFIFESGCTGSIGQIPKQIQSMFVHFHGEFLLCVIMFYSSRASR